MSSVDRAGFSGLDYCKAVSQQCAKRQLQLTARKHYTTKAMSVLGAVSGS